MAVTILDNARAEQAGFGPIMSFPAERLFGILRQLMYNLHHEWNNKDKNRAVTWLIGALSKIGGKTFRDMERAHSLEMAKILDSDGYEAWDAANDKFDLGIKDDWLNTRYGQMTPMETAITLNMMTPLRKRIREINDVYDMKNTDELDKKGLLSRYSDVAKAIQNLQTRVAPEMDIDNADFLGPAVDWMKKENYPTVEQIMLDPILYAEHENNMVRNFAKSLIQ